MCNKDFLKFNVRKKEKSKNREIEKSLIPISPSFLELPERSRFFISAMKRIAKQTNLCIAMAAQPVSPSTSFVERYVFIVKTVEGWIFN